MKIAIKILYLSIIAVVVVCCDFLSQHNNMQNSYQIVDIGEFEDCKVYAMIFEPENDYIFRYALSGTCEKFNIEDCLQLYKSMLKGKYIKTESISNRKIIIELYDYTKALQDSILLVTQKHLNVDVVISKKWDEGFEIKVGNVSHLELLESQ